MRTAVVVLALFAGLLAASAEGSSYVLTVTGEDGRRLWSLPVRSGDEVVLAYTNSIYLAPTEERLILSPTGFTLTVVRSTSEAVLAYNGLEASAARVGAFYTARAVAHLPVLVLRIGRTGRQRLIVGGQELPLYEAGEGAQLRVSVVRR
ncbi:MAG TPA: hypothetical protein VFJ45_02815 [bacterium]|nr:hypothetical protein [bacterium]